MKKECEFTKKQERLEEFEELYYSDLGMCGCGNPEAVKNLFYKLMVNQSSHPEDTVKSFSDESNEFYKNKSDERRDIITNTDPDTIYELIFHLLEHKEFTGEGSSVYGQWLEPKGKRFLELLKEFKDEE